MDIFTDKTGTLKNGPLMSVANVVNGDATVHEKSMNAPHHDLEVLALVPIFSRMWGGFSALKVRYTLEPELKYILEFITGSDMSENSANAVKDMFAAGGYSIIPATNRRAENEHWSIDEDWGDDEIRRFSEFIVDTISDLPTPTLKQNYSNADKMEATIREFVDGLHRFGHVLSKSEESAK